MKVFQDFEYEIKTVVGEDDSIEKVLSIGKYLENEKNVVIPDAIEGCPVTVVNGTFAGKEELERVTLPNKVVGLGVAAFQGCSRLKTIHFPSSLKKIESYAFNNCTSLEEITVSDSVTPIEKLTLNHHAFENCPKLCDENGFIILKTLLLAYQGNETKVTIPDGITKISEGAFWENSTVTSVVIPDSVVTVEQWAFHQCVNLTEITLSKELKTIGEEAFSNCKKLEQISLPEHLTEIEVGVFSGCESLKEIGWNRNLKGISVGAFEKCTSLEEVSFPDTLYYIQKSFVGCKNLREITIPPSVHTVDKKAFDKCDSLEIIDILERPEGTMKLYLQMSCFPYSKKMRENVLDKGQEVPQVIAKTFAKAHTQQYLTDLFAHWDKLSKTAKDLIREEWKKKITAKVKKGKNHLRNLVFLESTAKEMGIYFQEGFHLELPELEEYLEFSIKNGNTAETALLLDYKNKTYSKDFLEKLETRKEMVEIGLELPTLKELREKWKVEINNDFITIVGYRGNNTVEILPEKTNSGIPILCIDCKADCNFRVLEHLILPEGLEEIKGDFFMNWHLENLTELVIPKNVTKIDRLAFMESNITKIEILSPLNVIPFKFFRNCQKLKTIILPETLEIIEEYAFEDCQSLEEIHFHPQIKRIGHGAFSNCFTLKQITLPRDLEEIEPLTFMKCFHLEELNVPPKVKKLDQDLFWQCLHLKKIILAHESIDIHPDAFASSCVEFVGVEGGENLLHNYKKE